MGIFSSIGDVFKPSENHVGTDELYPDWMKQDIINQGKNIFDLQTPEYFPDSTIAAQNPWMQQSLQDMYGWGQAGGMGNTMMNNLYGQGNQALGAIGQGLDYMQGMQQRGPNDFQYDQGTYDNVMGNLAPGVQNMFDVNARQIQQGYDFNQLPGLNMAASQAGGYGGSKAMQQSALGQAMTAGNIQNMGSNLWMNAANQANAGGMQGGMANLQSANNFDSNMMSNYGRYGQMGANMLGDAYDMGISGLGLGERAGATQQAYDQSLVSADKARWDYEQNAPWVAQAEQQRLAQMFNNPNAIQYGASPFQTGLNAVTGIAGLYSGLPGLGGGGGGMGNQDPFFAGGWNGNSNGYW